MNNDPRYYQNKYDDAQHLFNIISDKAEEINTIISEATQSNAPALTEKAPEVKPEAKAEPAVEVKPEAKEPWQMTREEFIDQTEQEKEFRSQYVGPDGNIIASSRLTPAKQNNLPLGTWRIEKRHGINTATP